MYYDCLGGNQYRVTVKIYRDCNSDGAAFDPEIPVTIFDSNNAQIDNFMISYPGSTLLPVEFNNPCVTIPPDICVEEAVYQKVVTINVPNGGVTLSHQRCCRGPNIININNPTDYGLTLSAFIPGPDVVSGCNSSPRFNNYPPLLLCANEELQFDHSATDPDGDNIVYEFTTPFTGGGPNLTSTGFDGPAPNPSSPPPFSTLPWGPGYNANQALGNGANATLNSGTGYLTASPLTTGLFVVGVTAKEYRNGVLISQTYRDFLFVVVNCEIQMEAEITPQIDLPGFISPCQGLTIDFENSSYNGTNYFWDFGVPGVNSTSTDFEPTYTFPVGGEYDVMLIVNPGWTCTDTAYETFSVYQSFETQLNLMEPQCIRDNNFTFEVTGSFDPNEATASWNFGPNANTSTANDFLVNNIVYSDSGYQEVMVIVEQVCQDTIIDSVLVYGEPYIGFMTDPELKCAPYTAEFIDTSFSYTPILYDWNLGNGNTSTEQNPTTVYTDPGVYDVGLTIMINEGCTDTLTEFKPGYIEVFPSPTSQFSVSPEETNVFYPYIDFFDESSGGVTHQYNFRDGNSTTERNTTYAFQDTGYIYPFQVVVNQFGCPDTSYQQVYIEPVTTYYAPNAFTPDGDGVNDVYLPIVKDVYDYEFTIYNRWGEAFFITNDQNEGWDGTMNGKHSPPGVYVYTLYFRKMNKMPEFIHGHFTLVR